jgi:hypothetical protein
MSVVRHQELVRLSNLLGDQIRRMCQFDLPAMRDDYINSTLRINRTLREMQQVTYELREDAIGDGPIPLPPVNESQ